MDRRGFTPIVVAIIIAAIVLAGGTYFYFHQTKQEEVIQAPTPQPSSPSIPSSTTAVATTTTPAVTPTSVPPLIFEANAYPVVWTEDNGAIQFGLIGASFAAMGTFPNGTTTPPFIILHVRGENLTSSAIDSVPMHLAMLLDENGDFSQPAFPFTFSEGGDTAASNEVADEDVAFAVPPSSTDSFIFTTGGSSNIFFTATKNSDGSLSVQKELTEEPSSTTVFSHTCGDPIRVPQDTPSIQTALNFACSGDTIYIAAGKYEESVTTARDGVYLAGAPGTSPEDVVIDGSVSMQNNDFTISGLTISAGNVPPGNIGTGLSIRGNDVIAKNLIIEDNWIGMYITMSSGVATIDHDLIIDNHLGIEGQTYASSTLTMTNDTVANNTGDAGYDDCAGMNYGAHIFANDIFADNTVGIKECYVSASISSTDFWDNALGDYVTDAGTANLQGATPSPGTGDIKDDPEFVSPTDYQLQTGSPAAGMGAY